MTNDSLRPIFGILPREGETKRNFFLYSILQRHYYCWSNRGSESLDGTANCKPSFEKFQNFPLIESCVNLSRVYSQHNQSLPLLLAKERQFSSLAFRWELYKSKRNTVFNDLKSFSCFIYEKMTDIIKCGMDILWQANFLPNMANNDLLR